MERQSLFNISINKPDDNIYKEAKKQWDSISKPLDGMGDFEDIICQIAAIQKNVFPNIDDRTLIVFCADNGIVARGVTQSEQDVTKKVAIALGENRSAASVIAKGAKVNVLPVDIGINCEEKIPGVLDMKVASGTKDFLDGPALTKEQTFQAIESGIELVHKQKNAGVGLLATGEMGIGNTTTSAAVLSALLNLDSEKVVGRGAGLDDIKLQHKREVVRLGIEKYADIFNLISDEANRCFEILRCLGGLDIAAMCGVFIGGAIYGVPVVIDGVISSIAALLAQIFVPGTKEYMIASHSGREAGLEIVLKELGLRPLINGNMALGEGTGALMLFPLLDNALYLYRYGTRFSDNGIEDYERFC